MTEATENLKRLQGERFWSILDLFYGALVAWLAWRFIPLQTSRLPQLPSLLIGWGGLHFVLGLLSLAILTFSPHHKIRKLMWRLNVSLSVFTSILGLALTALCLMSGLYWLGVFGVLGWGVFISSLLLMSGVLQCFLLYPLLKLRRLLSTEYRLVFKGGGVPLLLLKFSLVFCVVSACLGAYHGHLTTESPLSDQQRDLITRYLRETLEGSSHTPASEQLNSMGQLHHTLSSSGMRSDRSMLAALKDRMQNDLIFVSFYAGGQRIARVSGRGKTLDQATYNAASALAAHPTLIGKRLKGGRLIVDRVIGEASVPFSSIPLLGRAMVALSVDPGVDGLRGRRGGATRTLLPSDLVEAERFGVAPIVPGIPELRFGVDASAVEERLGEFKTTQIYRIRTEQWVEREELEGPQQQKAMFTEDHSGPLTALTVRGQWGKRFFRAQDQDPQSLLWLSRTRYLKAAHLGGSYLVNHQQEDGRFDYQYFPYRDEVKQPSDSSYSVPRHAGAIYGLSLLFKSEAKPEYMTTAKKAIAWLEKYAKTECGGWVPKTTCIPKISTKDQTASLGQSALSALALLTYLENDHNERVSTLAHGLVEFLALMQRNDGDFHHSYLLYDGSFEPRERGMFASEQAAFAFVLAARQWPNETQWLKRAERALDALTIHKYEGDFLSAFFFGADHWTCLAAHAAYPLLKKREYLDFCLGYTRFLQRLQYRYELGEGDPAYHGHYGFGFLSPPQAPATGGFTEGVMGTLLLAEAHGLDQSDLKDIYDQVLASADALVSDQIDHESRWPFKNYERSKGAFRRSLVESEVRVDFVQHSLSALLMTQSLAQPKEKPKGE